MSKTDEALVATEAVAQRQFPESEGISEVAVRVHTLEKAVIGLKEENVSSFEVFSSLTKQNSQVIRAADTPITHMKVLLRVRLLLALGLVAVFLFVLTGR